MLFTEARCMRITSRNGSRLMYQPGQAAPGITFDPRFVSERFFFVASVAGARGSQSSATREDCREASPHMMGVTPAAESRPASESYGSPQPSATHPDSHSPSQAGDNRANSCQSFPWD